MNSKLIYLLALALGVVSVTTGCKHELLGIRAIPPGASPSMVGTETGSTISLGEPIPLATNWTLETMSQDHETLAGDTVHFTYDSAVMRNNQQGNLLAVASVLRSDPHAKLLVEGNCDERGTEEYNRSLGERRALSSREALARMGVDPMRICTVSYGKDKPADTGHSEGAWSKNRRDDFVLLHPKTTTTDLTTMNYDP